MKKSLGLLAAITAGLAIGGAAWADSTAGTITFKVEVPKILGLAVTNPIVDFDFTDSTVALNDTFDTGVYTAGLLTYKDFLFRNQEAYFGPTNHAIPLVAVLTNADSWKLTILPTTPSGVVGGATANPTTSRFFMKVVAASNSRVPAPAEFATYSDVLTRPTGATAAVSSGGQGYSAYNLYFALHMSLQDKFSFGTGTYVAATELVNLTLSYP